MSVVDGKNPKVAKAAKRRVAVNSRARNRIANGENSLERY